jgi:NADH-quinone oxidoreductase subunit L
MEILSERPGLLFVVATFLPLLSFALILLAGMAWALACPYRNTKLGESLYQLFGGDGGGYTAPVVATAAIGLAFVFSFVGLVTFLAHGGTDEAESQKHEKEAQELRLSLHEARQADPAEFEKEGGEGAALRARINKKVGGKEAIKTRGEALQALAARIKDEEAAAAAPEHRWSGHFDWLRVRPLGVADDQRGTALQLGFRIDSLAALMFVMVTFVSTLIHLYSVAYMIDENKEEVEDHQVHTAHGHLHRRGRYGRFFMFLSLFCFSMLNLVLADNLFQVFLSWELVGVCSYLLIGFYYERGSAANASNKAFITNRVGDAGFIIGLLIIWTYLGTFNIEGIFKRIRSPLEDSQPGSAGLALGGRVVRAMPVGKAEDGGQDLRVVAPGDPAGTQVVLFPRQIDEDFTGVNVGDTVATSETPRANEYGTMPYWLLVVAGLGIFLGCVGKSAQFPLQVWLPDAMEGPTPVSALIHAATMVAAGVYLVGRVYPLFTPEVLLVIAYVGAITAFVAATIAVVMTDIKKVLAYSTVSQLGFMMLALGVGGWAAGQFHLLTHAFFKALLFLGSGAVIYGCHHEQDMLKMGGLWKKMPVTAITMFIGVLAIAGIPLFSGWYSKDAILASALGFVLVHKHHALLFIIPLVTAGLTTFYMLRMWFLTFAGEPRDHHVYEHAAESPRLMTGPLVALAVCSVVAGWGWPLWDPEASWLEHQIHHSQPLSVQADFGVVPEVGEYWRGAVTATAAVGDRAQRLRAVMLDNAHVAGYITLLMVALGIVFAMLMYYYRVLDPEQAKEEFPRIHAFLTNKWYFDELYSVVLVRPALVLAHKLKAFDLGVIDGLIHLVARGTVKTAKADGRFDKGIIDGLVNLVADVFYGVGSWLRNVQTGSLRSYVLFLVLAAAGLFILMVSL